MRAASLLIAIIAMLTAASTELHAASSNDDGPSLTFTEPERALSMLGRGYGMLLMHHSGKCPAAGRFMREEAKRIHDEIERLRLPVIMVTITPDLDQSALQAWQQELALTHAVVAHDATNSQNISLNNIFQGRAVIGGRARTLGMETNDWLALLRNTPAEDLGSYRFPVDGLTDERAQTLWWMVERAQPNAVATLVKAAKRSAIQAEAAQILAAVDAVVTPVFTELQAIDSPSMADLEHLEAVLREFGELESLEDGASLLRGWTRNRDLRDELRARAAYRTCHEHFQSGVIRKQQQAVDGLRQLGEAMPETVYGQRAASEADGLAAIIRR